MRYPNPLAVGRQLVGCRTREVPRVRCWLKGKYRTLNFMRYWADC